MLRKAVVATCIAVFASMALSAPMTAHHLNSPNYITFSKPVRLPGVVLGSGTYIFESPDPMSAFDVVTVRSADRRHLYYMGMTHLVERPKGMAEKTVISLEEARPDVPAPVKVWWPIGESTGRQFLYDKKR